MHYAAQVEAWAAFADEPGFRSFVLDPFTLVTEDATGITGFSVSHTDELAEQYGAALDSLTPA